jgi:3-oxoadipate enol-lactonase
MTTPKLTATLLNPAGSDTSGLPTLVLGPSLGTGVQALWGPAVPLLAGNFKLIGWDLPGHGASAPSTDGFSMQELAEGVVDVVKDFESDGTVDASLPVYYAGVSIGGATALQLGHDYPGLFSGLAAICTAAKIGTAEAWHERAALVAQAGTPTQLVGSAQRWFAPGFIDNNAEVSTGLLHTLQNADRHAYAHACGALADFDLSAELPKIADPVLAVAGAHDQVCPPADAEAIAAGVANGRAAVVPSAAHLAPAEDPQATADLLLGFFRTEPKEA